MSNSNKKASSKAGKKLPAVTESEFSKYLKRFLSILSEKDKKATEIYDNLEAVDMNKVKPAS